MYYILFNINSYSFPRSILDIPSPKNTPNIIDITSRLEAYSINSSINYYERIYLLFNIYNLVLVLILIILVR